jgi:hypothetical protein
MRRDSGTPPSSNLIMRLEVGRDVVISLTPEVSTVTAMCRTAIRRIRRSASG